MDPTESLECQRLRNETYESWKRKYVSPSTRPKGAAAQMILMYVYLIGMFLALAWFVYLKFVSPERNSYKWLRVRTFPMLLLPHLALALEISLEEYFDASERPDQPMCAYSIFVAFLIVPLLAVPLLLRMLSFYRSAMLADLVSRVGSNHSKSRSGGTVYVTNKRAKASRRTESDLPATTESKALSDLDGVESTLGGKETITTGSVSTRASFFLWTIVKAFFLIMSTSSASSPSSGKVVGVTSVISSAEADAGQQPLVAKEPAESAGGAPPAGAPRAPHDDTGVTASEIRIWRFLSSSNGTILLLLIFLFPYILTSVIATATTPEVLAGCRGCFQRRSLNVANQAGAVVALLGLVVSVYVNRHFPDPFGIVREVKWASLLCGLPAVVFLVIDSYADAANEFSYGMLISFFLFVYVMTQSFVQCILALRSYRKERALMLEAAGTFEAFQRVLLVGSALHEAFEEHLRSEHAAENLAFHDDCGKFYEEFPNVRQNTAKSRFKKIVNLYVAHKSVFPCNLDGLLIDELTGIAEDPNAVVTRDVFEDAMEEIQKLMYRDGYARFIATEKYRVAAQMDADDANPVAGDGGGAEP